MMDIIEGNKHDKICKQCGQNKTSSDQSEYCDDCFAYNYIDNDEAEEDDDEEFEPCSDCDLPDACADFGCAIKMGIRPKPIFW